MLKLLHNCTHLYASKVMLKILQARLQQQVNCELSDIQAGFRKGRGTRDQIANIRWIMEKAREFQKHIYFWFIDFTFQHVWLQVSDHTIMVICMQVKKQQLELDMEQQNGSKLGKEYVKVVLTLLI